MRRASRVGLAGVAVVGLGLGLVAGGPLRARQVPGTQDFRPAGPSNVQFVEAPPRSVAWTRTWLQLQKVVPLEYPDGIKLGDLLKRVREETLAPELGFPRGVPIYVDRSGLAEADKTLDSEVTIDLDGVTLGKALRLALRSIHLAMELNDDGLIEITSASTDCDPPVSTAQANWQALDRLNEEVTELRAEVRALREALRPQLATTPESPKPAPAMPMPTPPPTSPTGGGFR